MVFDKGQSKTVNNSIRFHVQIAIVIYTVEITSERSFNRQSNSCASMNSKTRQQAGAQPSRGKQGSIMLTATWEGKCHHPSSLSFSQLLYAEHDAIPCGVEYFSVLTVSSPSFLCLSCARLGTEL